jgi:hypothetical protein
VVEKLRDTLLTHDIFVKKINYIGVIKQKRDNIIFNDGNAHSVQRLKYSILSSLSVLHGEEFLHGNGLSDEILSVCLAQENGKICP